MYSILKNLFEKYQLRSRYKLTIILPISLWFHIGLAHSNSDLPTNDLPIAGDWLYQSTRQMALLHINPDTSYSHVFINLDAPNSSFHHWGRIKLQANILQFIPSELMFYQQQSLALQKTAATYWLTHDLVTQPIQYSLSATSALLTLSSQYGDVDILGQQYQAVESHHTFGYWPDKLAIDSSYFVIFANGYYAQVHSNLDQVTDTEFLWGRLF
ncbi:hypothetical protein [Shewanella sp. OMA3-2]|uniref:hypothetical protein n=1 Tax=Shewanella sp. OMA3-2 TaxID=2908650 RepID=UPI001F258B0E|nr:hypothetical protein [Shewanella sp. OMA3-2]UJF22401.1 hypothetical protein L0B17_02970 [Shewanella sp. OMA3-2]